MSVPENNSADRREEEIFETASEQSASERASYLATACAGQPEMLRRLEQLLQFHEDTGFMQHSANLIDRVALNSGLAESLVEEDRATIGQYKVVEKIGEGGSGIVYKAQQEKPIRRVVALKILKPGTDSKSVVARFAQERQALAMMEHPNIAAVHDAGATDKGRPFFVMELVRGIKITKYCEENRLSTTERIALLVQVCRAIQHAHQKGVIHRDIKPSNILVTLHDGVPVPKVIDFGIAKAMNSERLTDQTVFTAFSHFIGTPAYMSPEQTEMSGLDIDTRSDIYSLGILLYELLTGHTPFDGQALISSGIDAMRKTICEQEPLPPSTRLTQELSCASSSEKPASGRLTIPTAAEMQEASRQRQRLKEQINRLRGDLDWIVLKCLEKDRSRRYETADALAADLTRHLSNEPVLARPPSPFYKLQKAWRRNRIMWAAATAVCLALIVGISLSTWQALEAGRARHSEKNQRLAALKERDNARNAQLKAENAEQAEVLARHETEHYLYVANMNLAGQAWDRFNYEGVRQRLLETRTAPDREFEWYYWQRQTHLHIKILRGHSGPVQSVMFSPDGQRLVSGGGDGTVRIWSVATGQQLREIRNNKDFINSVIFTHDGQQIIAGGQEGILRFWDSISGADLLHLYGGDGKAIHSLACSQDGHFVVVGTDDGAEIWDTITRRVITTFRHHTAAVSSVAFSPDGEQVVSGSYDRTARVWQTVNGKELYPPLQHNKAINAVLFSTDGRRIITGEIGPIAKVWDAATGLELPIRLRVAGTMTSLAISADGEHIMTGSLDSTARLWKSQSGDVEQIFLGHQKGVFGVAISPDGTKVATAAHEGGLKIWKVSDGPEALMLDGTNHEILAIALSPDGERIATASGERNDDDTTGGSGENAAQIWDSKNKRRLLALAGHKAGVSSIAFSPDGQQVLTGSGDQTAKLWDAGTGSHLQTFEHFASVTSVAFFPDGLRILTGCSDKIARVWDAATGRELFPLEGHEAPVSSVAVSPNGEWLLTGGFDHSARLWNAASRQLERLFDMPLEQVRSVAFSPDSRWVLTTGWGQSPLLWDLRDPQRLPVALKGHRSVVSSSAFSPDGQRILTGSFDETARLWETATGRELLTFGEPWTLFNSVAFSKDGRRIYAGTDQRTVRVWEAATPEQVAVWNAEEGR